MNIKEKVCFYDTHFLLFNIITFPQTFCFNLFPIHYAFNHICRLFHIGVVHIGLFLMCVERGKTVGNVTVRDTAVLVNREGRVRCIQGLGWHVVTGNWQTTGCLITLSLYIVIDKCAIDVLFQGMGQTRELRKAWNKPNTVKVSNIYFPIAQRGSVTKGLRPKQFNGWKRCMDCRLKEEVLHPLRFLLSVSACPALQAPLPVILFLVRGAW